MLAAKRTTCEPRSSSMAVTVAIRASCSAFISQQQMLGVIGDGVDVDDLVMPSAHQHQIFEAAGEQAPSGVGRRAGHRALSATIWARNPNTPPCRPAMRSPIRVLVASRDTGSARRRAPTSADCTFCGMLVLDMGDLLARHGGHWRSICPSPASLHRRRAIRWSTELWFRRDGREGDQSPAWGSSRHRLTAPSACHNRHAARRPRGRPDGGAAPG